MKYLFSFLVNEISFLSFNKNHIDILFYKKDEAEKLFIISEML